MTSRRSLLGLAALATLVAACGVPSSGAFTPIENENIPYGLGESTTTTTAVTTTTTVVTSTTPTIPPTTIATEPVTVFFLAGNQLVTIELALVRPASLPQVMVALEHGPPAGPSAAGLRSALRDDATNRVTEEGGVATVDLAPNLFENVTPSDQRLAIAQIVLTLTRQRGIGQVSFTQNGAPVSVPLASGEFTAPGQAVTHGDYEALLGDDVPPISTVAGATTTVAQ